MTLMSPLALSRRSSSRRVIVETDVDEYIAKYERRQSIKKRVMSVFHPFQHSRGHDSPTAHNEQQQRDKRFSLPNIPRDQAMDHPPCHDCSLSGSSTVSHDDADDDDSLAEIDVDDLRMKMNKKEPKRNVTDFSSTRGTVQMVVAMSMVYAIASRQSTAPTTTESKETMAEPAATTHHKDKLSHELLAAIVAHKRHEPAVILKPLSPQLASEIVNYSSTATSAAYAPAEVEPSQVAEQEEEEEEEASPRQGSRHRNGVVSKMTPDNNLESLKEKCANLATITELLSKQLVESALNKKRESLLQRKESKRYMEMLCRMESQRRAEMASWQSDKKYLEEKLRYNTKETVPPSIINKSDSDSDDEKQKKKNNRKSRELTRPRRHSFMDTMVTPVEFCVQNSTTPKSGLGSASKRASFSMASTMILQNRLLPAMLSAVANGGAMPTTTGASPKKAKPM